MLPIPNDPAPKSPYDPEEWPTLEELLQEFTMDQIEYGIYVSFEGGEEVSLVETGQPPDEPTIVPAPDEGKPHKSTPSSESDSP
jgi:hypothetical protein